MHANVEHFFATKKRLIEGGEAFAIVSVRLAPEIVQERRLILDRHGKLYGTTSIPEIDEKIVAIAKEALEYEKKDLINTNLPLQWTRPDDIESIIHYATMYIEIVEPAPKLVIVGQSEVGRAVANKALGLEFRIILVGEHSHHALEISDIEAHSENHVFEVIESLYDVVFDKSCYIVYAQNSNDTDLLKWCLNKPWAYFGILGSRKKIQNLMYALEKDGFPHEKLNKIHAPMGFEIGAQKPDEIAIAVLAEIIAIKNHAKMTR
jgi:xanthine dehydrogenase accessory factor